MKLHKNRWYWGNHKILWIGGVKGHPYPIALFDHKIVIHSRWIDVRLRRNWLTISFKRRFAYISPDATPNKAIKMWGRYTD